METRRNYTRQKKAYAPKVSEQGKLQPQDKELEEAVLGALMLEKDAYTTVCDILKPECFYEPTNQLIYSAISRLGAQQRPSTESSMKSAEPSVFPNSQDVWHRRRTSNTMPAS